MTKMKLKKGYDIPLEGAPEATVADGLKPTTVALCPPDFLGVKFRLLAREGDKVKLGSPLLQNKAREDHLFTSPAGGTVKAVVRGHRRALLGIIIEVDEKEAAETFTSYAADKLSSLKRNDVVSQLLKSGAINFFRERPFNYVANAEHTPRDIFISAFDTAPLAADQNLILKGNEAAFQAGVDVCAALTTGQVHISCDGAAKDVPSAFAQAKNAQVHQFSGYHPAGVVGVQIHHIKPVANRSDVVWHLSVQNAILLGRLFLDGKIDPSITVAVAGSGATKRQYYKTRVGAELSSVVHGNVISGEVRHINGNVLTGSTVNAAGHLGFYNDLVTIIPEVVEPEFIGWMLPGFGKTSWFRGFAGKILGGKKFGQSTCLNGGHRAFVQNDIYEDVLPMDVMPIQLIKSCLYEDIEEMEQLGIYEVCEDEVALCEYICPSKTGFQQIIRRALDFVEKEG
ncbi:hypothetical protein BVY04_01665 [bacterium M21]|nr:hypothetical protein BVY04_01665 [bacterium M21]